MIILLHVLIALSSIVLASFTFFKPTTKRLLASYGFIVATVASGSYLLLAMQADILRTCLSGLFYLTVVSIVTIATHVRVQRRAHMHVTVRHIDEV
ncbi:MAG: hypothetical protein ACOH18_03035 [Candidatus Saccharimonadaceae bacterium]